LISEKLGEKLFSPPYELRTSNEIGKQDVLAANFEVVNGILSEKGIQ
jgi:hypothetical protein